ncbi:LacI family DNA-binding transcriptional regulator [Vibrio ulleungensis]|uniref:LacI family DNA-binding transcriptional regulator n=1 Tax=Vibrio ulleungensis TaxID=2807619 RepID=A0ABS2HET3_9VIBR|nr:LacI family DNA-binding transcriptional regulator [Vibrio ulleungensis]MBM7034837.1 LacI family DNA-binding transcriptional regulator [Vibrio ulleungensis]
MSIKKLAEHLGLSKSTVSRALNGYSDVNANTRKKVLAAAQELGYRANPTAKRLASGRSRNVGIILPAASRMFVSPAFSKVLAGAAALLSKYDYQLIVTTISESQDEQQVYSQLTSGGLVDGLFIVRTRSDDARIKMLTDQNFPFVCHGFIEGFDSESFVDVDNQQAFYELTKRQINLGHTRIAFLDAPIELTLSQARQQGYLKAMREANLEVNDKWLLNGELNEDAAMAMTKEVMSLAKRPTSILCADDTMALGTIAACEELGYQPGIDVAIAGYGDYEHSRYSKPSITSLSYDTLAVGEEMAKLMLNKLENMQFDTRNWYVATIVPRQSDSQVKTDPDS